MALKGTRSSLTPMKKMTNRATRINLIWLHKLKSTQIREEIKNPQKMAIPPMEGVTFLWIFRRPGMSSRFLLSEYLIMTGTIRKEITNDVIAAASCIAIVPGLRGENKGKNGIGDIN